jgi:hypothetical protein
VPQVKLMTIGADEAAIRMVIHKPEMATVIWWLPAALLERQELVAQINERRVLVFPAKLELEDPRVERQRFLHVAHLQRNVIETHGACFFGFRHETLTAAEQGQMRISTFSFQPSPGPPRSPERRAILRLLRRLTHKIATRFRVGTGTVQRIRAEMAA